MGIYIITVIVSFILAHLSEVFKSKSSSNKEISSLNPLFYWLLNIFLVVVSGFRYMNYYLGDEWNYRNNFDRLIDSSLNFKEIIGIEGGNYFFTWVLANIFNNSQAYIFLAL